ncbi:unnamed protein product [Trichobilharzia szidati]|nr:unnamed protein product [Trichobilharzia szidati]
MTNTRFILLIIAILWLHEISFGYILVCRKMVKKGSRPVYGYYGDCPECKLICRVLTDDMRRPEHFTTNTRKFLTAEEKLKEKIRRADAPKGLYDNPYNPGLWKRTTAITAPYAKE